MSDEKHATTHSLNTYKRRSDFNTIYINNVNFAFTAIDIQMICSRTVASMDKESTSIEEVATVVMTPSHAIAVLESLALHIRKYEEAHGKIHLPKDMQAAQPSKEETVKEKIILGSASKKNRR